MDPVMPGGYFMGRPMDEIQFRFPPTGETIVEARSMQTFETPNAIYERTEHGMFVEGSRAFTSDPAQILGHGYLTIDRTDL